jgi:hypothetical protein
MPFADLLDGFTIDIFFHLPCLPHGLYLFVLPYVGKSHDVSQSASKGQRNG